MDTDGGEPVCLGDLGEGLCLSADMIDDDDDDDLCKPYKTQLTYMN